MCGPFESGNFNDFFFQLILILGKMPCCLFRSCKSQSYDVTSPVKHTSTTPQVNTVTPTPSPPPEVEPPSSTERRVGIIPNISSAEVAVEVQKKKPE